MSKQIPLRARDGSIRAYAIVDDHDFESVGTKRWCLHTNGYAHRGTKEFGAVYLHREIAGLSYGDRVEVDHINRDRLDNRRENLRIVNRQLNAANVPGRAGSSSQYRGVHFVTSEGVWRARVKWDGKQHYLGRFSDEHEAARVVARFLEARIPDFDYWSTSTKPATA